MSSLDEIYNYLSISDSLALSGQPSEDQLQRIAEAGFEAIINLAPHDAPHALEDERKSVEALGMRYVHIPVDFKNPKKENLEDFESALADLSSSKLFIHCAANYRVTAFYGLTRVRRGDMTEAQAKDLIARVWDINQFPAWCEFFADICGERSKEKEGAA